MRIPSATAVLFLTNAAVCQQQAQHSALFQGSLPDAPSQTLLISRAATVPGVYSSSADASDFSMDPRVDQQDPKQTDKPAKKRSSMLGDEVDADGKPIPLELQQPKRILGFMPNYRSVAAGAKVHPPGWRYNFNVATKQAFDYSSFVFLGLTSISAEGLDEHPKLGKGIGGMYEYTWRGFLDKTDGTYLGAWLLPSLLHEDTRFYPMGHGHAIPTRVLYIVSRQAVTRTYGGHQTPNIAGLGGKVLTQVISRNYYPAGTSDFGILAEKFAYSAMRDIIFSSIREFYPDIAAHYIRRHREKMARLQATTLP